MWLVATSKVQTGRRSGDFCLDVQETSSIGDDTPRLQRENSAFRPRGLIDPPLDRRAVSFNIPAEDRDPYDPTAALNKVGGAPSYLPILRRKIAILGRHPATGRDTCYIVPTEWNVAAPITFSIPDDMIAPGNIVVRIRLCDCLDCDTSPGSATCPFVGREGTPSYGTCFDTDIPQRLLAGDP